MLVSFFANHAFIFSILIILERQRFFVSVYHVYSFLFLFFFLRITIAMAFAFAVLDHM